VTRVLTIGPSDSSGATGIQADLRVFEALGVEGLCAVTAVLAADGRKTRRRFEVPPRVVEAQIDAVAPGGVDATKVSALHDRTLVDALAERVRRRRLQPVVLDPGILDEKGERILGRNGVEWLRKRLLPQTAVVVLSRAEAQILAGTAPEPDDAPSWAAALQPILRAGVAAVVLRPLAEAGVGWLLDAEGARPLKGNVPRAGGPRDRFTAALTVRLALGDTVSDAVRFVADDV
jgi:hydroxymethylpyrimidine/phosphomethylpyrimidine kinase